MTHDPVLYMDYFNGKRVISLVMKLGKIPNILENFGTFHMNPHEFIKECPILEVNQPNFGSESTI